MRKEAPKARCCRFGSITHSAKVKHMLLPRHQQSTHANPLLVHISFAFLKPTAAAVAATATAAVVNVSVFNESHSENRCRAKAVKCFANVILCRMFEYTMSSYFSYEKRTEKVTK